MRLFALTLICFMVSSTGLHAQSSECGLEEVQALFCTGMQDESLYDKHGFDSYKMLVPGMNGWIFRSESDFRNDFTIPDEKLDDLEELSRTLRAHGTELVMLVTPTRGLVHSQYITDADKKRYGLTDIDKIWKSYWSGIESIRSRGIHVVGIGKPGPEMPFFYRKDHHWNPYGAQQSARAIAEYVKKLDVYAEIPKVEYTTYEDGVYDFYGVSKKVFKRICDTRQPPERIIKKITEKASVAEGADELFGDTSQPEIVLLGTSNSTMEPSMANFEGFLNESLSADILNMSVSGGGLDTAMISYLNSEQFKSRPAKIAIWEIPGYYDLSNHDRFFREAIPATYGSCENNPVASSKGRKITEKTIIGLDKLAGRGISGKDYYLSLNFSAPITEPLTVDFRYVKNRDKYKFDRSGRYPHDGTFYVALHPEKKEQLEKIVLNFPDEAKGKTVDIILCRKDEKTLLGKHQSSTEPKHASGISVEDNTKEVKL